MSNYSHFAQVYDSLMDDVDYRKRAAYITRLFKKHDRMPELLLDVACGTGGFSEEFAAAGTEVIGVDMSEEMLTVAREKSAQSGSDVLYLCQRAEELDLYGTVDGAICCLDSINHITDLAVLHRAFSRISLFLEPGRLFIFDVNTEYKHKMILGNNTFVIDTDEVYCVWRNSYKEKRRITDIELDFFIKSGDTYVRSDEALCERAYTPEELADALNSAGLTVEAIYDEMTENTPTDTAQRVIYVTRKAEE